MNNLKKNLIKTTFLFILVCLFFVPDADARKIQYLDTGWTFGQARNNIRYPAMVPGVVQTDLLANGLIDNPYFGMNERTVQWVDKEDWVYDTSFSVDPDVMSKDNIEIVFKGLDTYADIFLNDSLIIKADNMFRIWKAYVKPLLKSGDNHLRVYFHSPIKIDMPKWDNFPNQYSASNDQSENGGIFDRKLSVFARKAAYHYGWDWGPRLVTSGIWRDVFLEAWDYANITDTYFRQDEVNSKSAKVTDIVEVEADRCIADAVLSVKDGHTGKVLASKKVNLDKGINKVEIGLTIRKPRLWWCNGLGKPERYTFITTVEKDGTAISSSSRKIGLRDVKVVTDSASDGSMQFYFVINNVPVFAKGTNYIPQDNFLTSVGEDRYRATIEDAVAANMNMIRVWGGGIYENDIFYDLCDEMGLMVWQDFMFACSVYPAREELSENVTLEAADNVRRLRNHPSVVIWCGGNECLDAWYNWGWKSRLERKDSDAAARIDAEQDKLYFETLPLVMAQHAPDAFYWPNSPFSGRNKGSDGVNGDRHYYGVWQRKHPIAQYNNERSHFFSEYGFQSFPQYETILKYAPDDISHRLDSDVMMWHQRGGDTANSLIAWYLENEYRNPTDFKDFIYASQVLQGDAMRTAIEAHRRNMPYCMGSLLWQHNDCWPVASWSTRDYYGNWKAAHYMVKKAFENLIVSAVVENDSVEVFTVSDLLKLRKGQLSVSVNTLDGKEVFIRNLEVDILPNTSARVWRESVASILGDYAPSEVYLAIGIISNNESHEGIYFLGNRKDLNLRKAEFEVEVLPGVDDEYKVKVQSDSFARAVCLSLNGESAHFSDNFFDLQPGKPVTVSVRTPLDQQQLEERLNIACFNNIK